MDHFSLQTTTTTTTTTTPMIINDSYGGFGFSDLAIAEYNKRVSDEGKISQSQFVSGWRFDPVMIQIVEELGDQASDKYASLKIVNVLTKYVSDYIDITEYDGKESFRYDTNAYQLDQIKRIVSSTDDSTTQIQQIKKVLSDE